MQRYSECQQEFVVNRVLALKLYWCDCWNGGIKLLFFSFAPRCLHQILHESIKKCFLLIFLHSKHVFNSWTLSI